MAPSGEPPRDVGSDPAAPSADRWPLIAHDQDADRKLYQNRPDAVTCVGVEGGIANLHPTSPQQLHDLAERVAQPDEFDLG